MKQGPWTRNGSNNRTITLEENINSTWSLAILQRTQSESPCCTLNSVHWILIILSVHSYHSTLINNYSPCLWTKETNMNSEKFITNSEQLKTFLHKCSRCYSITNKGKNIFSINDLFSFNPFTQKTCTFAIIVNTLNESFDFQVGHWITIVIYKKINTALIIDSLNNYNNTNKEVLKSIALFCKRMNLKIKYLYLRTQQIKSQNCGYHSLYWTHFAHNNSLSNILEKKKVLSRYALKNLEKYIVNNVLKRLN